jgi:hypothetical protein
LIESLFGTQVDNQDQAQEERKGLKEVFKITHHDKSNIGSIKQRHFKRVSMIVLGERSLLPLWGMPPSVGKPSTVLGWLTWKW